MPEQPVPENPLPPYPTPPYSTPGGPNAPDARSYGHPTPPPGQQPCPQQPQAQQYPYVQQPSPGQQPSYGQQYLYAQQYPSDGGYMPPEPQPRSPLLGIIGCAVVLLAGIAILVASWHGGHVFGRLLQANGGNADNVQDLQDRLPQYYQPFLRSMQLASLFGSLGFAGWVACIVATVRRSARPLAVTGIVVGVLVVLASLGVFVAAFMPYMPQH